MRPSWVTWVGLKFNDKCLCKTKKEKKQAEKAICRIGRVWSYAVTSLGHQGLPAAIRNQEKCGTVSPSEPPEEINPADTLVLDFLPLKL